MADKKTYTADDIQALKWNEAVRLRPGMYIGSMDNKGLLYLLKIVFDEGIELLAAKGLSFHFMGDRGGRIVFSNINKPVPNIWTSTRMFTNRSGIWTGVLNALSSEFTTKAWAEDGDLLFEQSSKAGFSQGEEVIPQYYEHCESLEINFLLDETIWEDLDWNKQFFLENIREHAYLYKDVRFDMHYETDGETCKNVYHFKGGLKDKLELRKLKGLGGTYFDNHFDIKIEDLQVEIAFAFLEYSVDQSFLESHANHFQTIEHGTHMDGLLQGLTKGVMKYFQKEKLTQIYRISEKGIREHLIAIIHVKMQNDQYSGCVKNKLANPEIIEPISQYVAEAFFQKILANEPATQQLIRKFKI